MRLLQVTASAESPEAYKKTNEQLRQDIGEPIKFKKDALVPADPDAIEKLKRLQGGR